MFVRISFDLPWKINELPPRCTSIIHVSSFSALCRFPVIQSSTSPTMHSSFSSLVLGLLLSLVSYGAALTLTSNGGTLMLGDIAYYVPGTPYTTVSVQGLGRLQSVNGLSPVTVIGATANNATLGSLGSIVADFATDDVWNPDFLQGRGHFPSPSVTSKYWKTRLFYLSSNYPMRWWAPNWPAGRGPNAAS